MKFQTFSRSDRWLWKKVIAFLLAVNLFGVLFLVSSEAYVVKPGDTLSQLALQLKPGRVYGKSGRLARLIAHNPHIGDPDRIQAGKTVVLFPDGAFAVKDVPSVADSSVDPPLVQSLDPVLFEPLPVEKENVPKVQSDLVFDLGAGISYLAYREKINSTDFKLNEAGITIEGGASYRLAPRWDIEGSAFITAIPIKLSSSPVALSTARFYGINARASYELCQLNEKGKLYLSAGWYLWGMAMPAATSLLTYGVSYLGGPQVFLNGHFKTESGRAYSVYGKFAAMLDNAGFSVGNRELAMGGSYQISAVRADEEQSRLWLLGLDLANDSFSRQDQEFQLNSVSLRITTRF